MSKLKITVVKTTFYPDLAEEYAQPDVPPCPYFAPGQEFVIEYGRPENFCTWAWNDLSKFAKILSCGGDFGGWSKNKHALIRCCTHGIRPVIFNLECLPE